MFEYFAVLRIAASSAAESLLLLLLLLQVVSVAGVWTSHPLRTAAAAPLQPCYCTSSAHLAANKTATTYVDREPLGHRSMATVTVRLNSTRPNNSLYRYFGPLSLLTRLYFQTEYSV